MKFGEKQLQSSRKGVGIMESKGSKHEEKQPYVKPRVLATYKKKELEEMIMPHVEGGGCGYGCGGG
jgi:hypothetical protein